MSQLAIVTPSWDLDVGSREDCLERGWPGSQGSGNTACANNGDYPPHSLLFFLLRVRLFTGGAHSMHLAVPFSWLSPVQRPGLELPANGKISLSLHFRV